VRRWLKRFTLLLLLVLTITAGGIAWFGSSALIAPQRRGLQDFHQKILKQPSEHGMIEPISFRGPRDAPCQIYLPHPHPGKARKSRALRAELTRRGVPVPPWGETVGTIVLLHGRHGRKEDHLPIAERFCAAGFACIVWDLPGHGDSPCPHATFGSKECDEIEQVLRAAQIAHRIPDAVALFGVSQGAAIALQTIAKNDHYYAVAAVASFADLGSLIEGTATQLQLVPRLLSRPAAGLVRLGAKLRAGFDPASIRPARAAQSITQPVLIGHGARDNYIAPSHARAIFDAIPHDNKILHLIPDGAHHNVLAKGGNDFYADLAEFFLKNLPASARYGD
jgi:alpha-beta hydrolase superfamily lysophospholipase